MITRTRTLSKLQQYRSVLLLVGALAVGALAAVGTRSYIAEQVDLERERLLPQREEIDVIVAKRDLVRGDIIGPDTVAVRRMPREFASDSIIRPERYEAFAGSRLNMAFRSGEPLIAHAVEGQESSAFSTKLRAGVRALTISVDEVNSISGMLQPGDRIDLQLSARPPARGVFGSAPDELTRMLMQDVLVLATGKQVRQVNEEGTRSRVFTSITLEVTPEQAQKLVVAQRAGRLTATLRHRDDRVVVDQKAIDIGDLLGVPQNQRARRMPMPTELIVGNVGRLQAVPLPGADAAGSAVALLQQLGVAAMQAQSAPSAPGARGNAGDTDAPAATSSGIPSPRPTRTARQSPDGADVPAMTIPRPAGQ